MEDQKLLIFGASSYIGRRLLNRLGPEKAVGTYFSSPSADMVYFDSLTMDLAEILNKSEFSHAVILLGNTHPDSCVADVKRSNELNVRSIERIINELTFEGIIPIFTSSEFVFDGTRGNYVEEDLPSPILIYGRQKLKIEEHLKDTCKQYVILRLAKVYGDTPGDQTLFSSWLDMLLKGQREIRCAADQRFSPVFIDDVVEGIIKVYTEDHKGIYHMAGPSPYTRIELLKMLITRLNNFKVWEVEVKPCSIRDFNLPEKRPVDVSMKPNKLIRETGISLTKPADACDRILKKYLQEKLL